MDFANTVYAPRSPLGALKDFNDVVAFLEASGAVNAGEARRLRGLARARPRRSATIAFARALAMRDMLRALLAALAAGEPVRPQWVELVNEILRLDLGYPQLVAREAGWTLAAATAPGDPLAALVPVARSTAELIEQGSAAPIRKCASPTCVLYFYDASRTATRRWCSMAVCGNRTKVAAYARRKARPGACATAERGA